MDRGCAIRVLGGFRVEVEGRAVPDSAWRHRRGADLVKILAIAPDHRLHREQIMDALWPDLAPEAAAANLRKATHFARRALGSVLAIGIEGPMVELWPSEASVDLTEFEHAAVAAANGDDVAAKTATVLYAGELLPEDPYADWTSAARERARSTFLQVLRVARMWERLVEVDPTDEEAHRELMRSQVDAGNRQAAIRQFERLRNALREELGVSPDAATVELYERVLEMEGDQPPTPQERVRATLAWGLVHWNRRALDEAERSARSARSIAIDAGLGRELGEASALLGLVAHARGNWAEQFRIEFTDSLQRPPDLASHVFDAHLCFAEFSLYGPAGHEAIVPFARELLGLATEAESIQGEAVAATMLGEAALLSGDLDDAERDLSRAVELSARAGQVSAQCLTTERLAEVAIARGRRWEATRLLAKAKRLSQRSALESHLLVRVLGASVLATADPGRALSVVVDGERALARRDVCDPCSMTFRVASATAAARAGDFPRAERHLEDSERLAGMWQGGPWLASVWEARGVLRQAHGERGQAAALYREAAESFSRSGRVLDARRCVRAAEQIAS